MQRKGRGSFSFFIKSQHTEFVDKPMFAFSSKPTLPPYLPATVTLFGSMTLDECKALSSYLYLACGIRMRVPPDFDHARFHGDVLILSFSELINQIHKFFGHPGSLPTGACLSMSSFFDYIRDSADLTSRPSPTKKSISPN